LQAFKFVAKLHQMTMTDKISAVDRKAFTWKMTKIDYGISYLIIICEITIRHFKDHEIIIYPVSDFICTIVFIYSARWTSFQL